MLVSNQAFLAVLRQDAAAFAEPFDSLTADVRDPENLYYMALMASYMGDIERTLAMLERAVSGGWFCAETIAGEPWLAPVRSEARFDAVVEDARARHAKARSAFERVERPKLLGL